MRSESSYLNQKGNPYLAFIHRYYLFMGEKHTPQALLCLNTKHTAAKLITKGQHGLVCIMKIK
ncbi:hypothetical protein B0W48_15425 [Pseudoalteromonas aliena]|uniref:Uncharacterized protein n=1 Tax=Pseudoalteromonas aliena TaxID=247523 RepID=A0A1Q2H124_9GAMM|nr:hypothetical protein B0W48_15425 [Pseudoalteromonas aliena]